ncbi:hypothetical protein ACHAXR_008509, partial [Thalassiosira sp. AJA248-18]
PWSVMGGMAGSFVTSARGVVSNAASLSVAKQAVAAGGDSNIANGEEETAGTKINAGQHQQHQHQQQQQQSRNKITSPPSSSGSFSFSTLTSNITSSVSQLNTTTTNAALQINNINPLASMTKSITQSISHNITGKNTLPDKTTASQVLMFRQLLHTKCRPGLRLSRNYEGTAAQMAVLHMPWWERGIEQSKKMIISYDNLITRLWLSGAIMPFEKGGYAAMDGDGKSGTIDTLINERGLPPVPHSYWVDRLGFQQDDPVTDFRSGGVLSLAMLVHIVESCPAVHSRFVPKPKADSIPAASINNDNNPDGIISLEEIITDDASVLPFGITCINITDMLAKFLLFSKAVDKMDALLSAKPFWKMFIDPNAMLVLQEVSLDLLCDVCVEIGRERRTKKLSVKEGFGEDQKTEGGGMPGTQDGKVTVFDFSEIMERTEKRVGDEVLGAGPQNVDELRAIARRVKSKYLMRIQLKEKHSTNPSSPLGKQIPPMPSKESMRNVTNSVIGGVGGFVSMLKKQPPSSRGGGGVGGGASSAEGGGGPSTDVIDFTASPGSSNDNATPGGQEVEVNLDGRTTSSIIPPKSPVNPFASSSLSPNGPTSTDDVDADDDLDKLSAELGELSAATAEAFDFLGDDFNIEGLDVDGHSEELLDAMGVKVDALAAFAIDDDEFLS